MVDGLGLGGPSSQVDDLVVGEVGGLDPAGDAVFGAQPADAAGLGVDLGGRVAHAGPAVAEDGVGAGFGGAAERPPVAEQVAQAGGDDVGRWPLGGLDGDDARGAASGDDVAVGGVELLLLGGGADGGGVVGDLVDGHEADRPAEIRGDLAHLVVEQPLGALVDLVLQPAQGVDGLVDGRADEPFGAVAPQAQLDPFAVDQDQAAVGGQGAVGDDQLQGDGLAAA